MYTIFINTVTREVRKFEVYPYNDKYYTQVAGGGDRAGQVDDEVFDSYGSLQRPWINGTFLKYRIDDYINRVPEKFLDIAALLNVEL